MQRGGRDSPGSNWVVYMYDPDGMRTELFYGMEQIGWDRLSKPDAMRYQGTFELPPRPQPSEETELQRAVERGIDLLTGRRSTDVTPDAFDVGGIMLPRPFKVTKVGPAHLFVEHVAASEQFYVEQLGLQRVEEATFRGHRVVFLRHGTDHHSVGLFPIELRSELGLDPRTKLMSFGLQVGSYQQLRDAVAYLRGKGIDCIDLPPALYPGIDYAAHIIDPDGHCICLYYYMEQVGWDGQPRPKSKRPPTTTPWPQAVDALSDTYVDQLFQGPLG
jgi:catechol 2,3-dioxygenase-like lactoylglutathione lyase family enzyme